MAAAALLGLLIVYAAWAQGYEGSTYVNGAQISTPSGYEQAQGGGGAEALAAPLAALPAAVPSLPQGDAVQGAASPAVAQEILPPDTGAVVHPDDSGISADVRPADNGGVQPEPESTRRQVAQIDATPSERGSVICAVFGDLCEKALRVAECESGPDYSAEFNGVHVGSFQIATRYHAEQFMEHGWDIYADGDDPFKNATIALEILAGRDYIWTGSGGWPVCGWR